ncbi:MAG: division/cell wall cluster transcriptional repressor MraZ [Pseudomonadota bacterium]
MIVSAGRSGASSFLGTHTNKIDAKGRVQAPADFRKALDLVSFNGFFCVPSLEGDHLDCGGPDYIEGLKASIAALDPFDPDRRALEVALLGQARPVTFDQDGRFILHKELRDHAQIADRAKFVGLGDTFQIWRDDGADEIISDQKARARAALRRLRNPGVTPPSGAEAEAGS